MTDATVEPDDATVVRLFAGQSVDQDNVAHYRGLLEKRLLINRCHDCGTWHHPARPLCPRCWSIHVDPTEVSGRGAIALITFLAGTGQHSPHPVATVDLDEQPGLRYTATIVGPSSPDTVRIGARVELTWIAGATGAVPAFRAEAAR